MKSATVVNHLGESLVMELENPGSSGFKIFDIRGLGPVKGDINTSKIATVAGVTYNSATVGGRNIVFEIGFEDDPSIEENRLKSYRLFPVTKKVQLTFITDSGRIATVSGYVESNEPTIFSEEGTTQISIVCESAYFSDSSPTGVVNTLFYNVEDVFEFPFSNESLTQDLIEFGRINTEMAKTVVYTGDVEVGISIDVQILGDVGDIVIYRPDTNQAMRINALKIRDLTGSALVAGDALTILTSRGVKGITLLRNGVRRNVLNALDRTSDWLTLSRGENQFAYYASYGASNIQMSVKSNILYEGL